jgi:hydrogenase maturation protein HypF
MSSRASPAAAARPPRRVRARIDGTVRGVGFRPFASRLARELGLAGHVRSDACGVVLEVEGAAWAVDAFLVRLRTEAPPPARVRAVAGEELAPVGERGFAIRAGARGDAAPAAVAPDRATCRDCVAELLDPTDRRYRYPFVNCANCGPRFTIAEGVPCDRSRTTMAGFQMCARCRAEYDDPLDRRYHAPSTACPVCGPRVELLDADGVPVPARDGEDAVARATRALLDGAIVAVKGAGGYHLACRADDEDVVRRLRARKRRQERPMALMVHDLQAARALVLLSDAEEELLLSPERPIVLARSWAGARVAPSVAPDVPELGVMLPSSPLHLLLLGDGEVPLVLTSGNAADEPTAVADGDALARLRGIADRFLVHDRPIATRADDSVARVVELGRWPRPLLLRRSRGYVPAGVELPLAAPLGLLGCGAERRSTFCVARGTSAWVGQHVGDLADDATARAYRAGVRRFERLLAVTPRAIAHDLHAADRATVYAHERAGAAGPPIRLIGVQHHHAHLAACLAEHGEHGRAVGAIYDGSGHGADGTVWGGELLVGSLAGWGRAGHLRPVRMPGGERAIREPWRMACAWLLEAYGDDPGVPAMLAGRVDPDRWAGVAASARSGVASPLTSSMGRLFDAVAALCGLRAEITYEGQAAVALAAAADPVACGAYPLPIREDGTLDAAETIRAVVGDLEHGAPVGAVAACFHAGVARATAEACAMLAERHGLDAVVLSGGVFQNRLLLQRTADALTGAGLRVLVPERLPLDDGGIAYGQVAVAAAVIAAR